MASDPEKAPLTPDHGDDRYEDFVRVFTRHEAGLRAFVRSLLPTWNDVDEVMQEASLVIWRKFDQFDPDSSFMKWACVIARFEVLKYRRQKARDRHVFNENLLDLLAAEGAEEADALSARRAALKYCLQKLPEKQRRVLLEVYSPGRTIKQVAESVGRSATALYKMVNRARADLSDCVERAVKKEGLA